MTPGERAGELIDQAMQIAGISQSELARRMDQHPSSICRILKNTSDVKFSTLVRAIEACGFKMKIDIERKTR